MTWMLIILLLIVISYLLIKGKTQTNIEPVSKFGKMPCDEPKENIELISAQDAFAKSIENEELIQRRMAQINGFNNYYDYQKNEVLKQIHRAISNGQTHIDLYKTFEDRPKGAESSVMDWHTPSWSEKLENEFTNLGYYLKEIEYTRHCGGFTWPIKYMCLFWDTPNTHPQ